ncbi:hypothetical protein [Amycolatopsis pittospori]|uniref:hypothetical protein n=1 Tax=Amycolatopsis pittospori TaxID=2749434 RepID=UPI002E2921C1|nr:hypothetical protein [Amycolatopsis pittospori]
MTENPLAAELPMFFRYYGLTYRVDGTPDGGLTGHLLNLRTGRIEEDASHIQEVLFAMGEDITVLDEARYVELTEIKRSRALRGEGPIFALYDAVQAVYDKAKEESRRLEPEEHALIRTMRARTFGLWEQEFARRDAGEAPTFEFDSLLGGTAAEPS